MIIRLERIGLFNTNTKEEVSVYFIRITEKLWGFETYHPNSQGKTRMLSGLKKKGKKNRLVSTGTLLTPAHSTNWFIVFYGLQIKEHLYLPECFPKRGQNRLLWPRQIINIKSPPLSQHAAKMASSAADSMTNDRTGGQRDVSLNKTLKPMVVWHTFRNPYASLPKSSPHCCN